MYQYYYLGYRSASRGAEPGAEYVFDVSADRRLWFPVPVFVAAASIASWQRAHQRDLNSTEQYAIAKLALFQAFDQREDPAAMTPEVRPTAEDVESILTTLQID